jgi:hypothetical protein
MELGISIPDPMVLSGALQKATDGLSMKSPQVAYRLNMVRQQLGVDVKPTFQAIWGFSEHVQAEAEELMIGLGGDGGSGGSSSKGGTSKVSIKSLQEPTVSSGSAKGGSGGEGGKPSGLTSNVNAAAVTSKHPCRFWGVKDDGCHKADQCKFVHSMLSSKDGRCFACSAVGHSRKECPHVGGKKKVAKTKAKEPPPKGSKGAEAGAPMGPPPGIPVPEKSPTPVDKTKLQEDGVGSKGTVVIDDLLAEAKTLMKTIRPNVKAIHLKKTNLVEKKTGLLDGGATNALRTGSAEEIAAAVEVQVELAAGTAQLYQAVDTGTLLSPFEVEPIVPLRGLVNLGYKIRWDSSGCTVDHGRYGQIRCWLRNGCPVVHEQHALALIKEIERDERMRRCGPRLAAGQVGDEVRRWWLERFPHIPDSVLQFMVGQGQTWDASRLPWNRKIRKRHRQAKGLIIHLFSGDPQSTKEWNHKWSSGIEVIALDVMANPLMDLHNPDLWGYLTELVTQVPIIAIVGGPPCRSVSRLRNIRPGPVPLRGRSSDRYGLGGLGTMDQLKVDGDSALFLKQLGLWCLPSTRMPDATVAGGRVPPGITGRPGGVCW